MKRFDVWAPAAGQVALEHDGRRIDMERSGDGWWFVEVGDAVPGDLYGFSLDGGPCRPDPRAMALPEGVHGRAAVVDHGAFDWTDHDWAGMALGGSVLYELHVGTFTAAGTFDAAIERLPHLVDLGIDAIEVMPVASFEGRRGWGYDGVGLFAPHAGYGGPEGLKRLVDSCHRAGIGVILDVVYNHLGPSGNYLSEFGPYFSESHQTNWGAAVNLDGPGSDEVRRFLADNAIMWLEDYHIDGLRLDAVHALIDDSAIPFLEQLSVEVSQLSERQGPRRILIAESDRNDPRYVQPAGAGGLGLDAAWADEWHHAWHAVFAGETTGYYEDFGSLEHLGKALQQAWVYDGTYSTHRRRTHGRRPVGLTGDRFVVSTQNHDQVGNRAAGERSSALMSTGRLKTAAGLLLTAPFVPMLFMGEEWGASTPWLYFTDFADDDLGRAVTEGRRSEFSYFGWDPDEIPDPQDPATFERSRLRWDETDKDPHAGLLEWYRGLIRLRRQEPDLSSPDRKRTSVRVDDKAGTLEVQRGSILIFASVGSDPVTVETGPSRLLMASSPHTTLEGGRLRLHPDSLAIVSLTGDPGGDGAEGTEFGRQLLTRTEGDEGPE
ncbi:MAG TPA: malto-oligosyltrehalose trehalohydrolase [Acidimicrobiales bacterium]|nr:malto-oligosyltrehalose trehalohydrolase [Acidimicrobiales bacterium]